MPEYQFRDRDLGLSHEGVHLLRNGFNYKTIPFKEIQKTEFKKGNVLKNRVILLIVGIGVVGFSIYAAISLYDSFYSPDVYRIYIEELLVPILPFFMGAYALYAVLRKEEVIVFHGEKRYTFSLKSFIKEGKMEEIRAFLKEKGLAPAR